MKLTPLRQKVTKSPLNINIDLCAECHNTGILAVADCLVGNEHWCTPCSEAKAGMCERCGIDFENEDLHHGDAHESCCYDCGLEDAK